MKALVYVDSGVGDRARLVVPSAMQQALGPRWEVATVNSSNILGGALSNASVLIIPGGADLPYCQALNGEGCARIREFVHEGGTYIGLCAGAYFASENIEWNRGEVDQIIAPRELAFFKGTAVGPAFGPGTYDPDSESGARIVRVTTFQGTEAWAYHNGGCLLIGSDPSVNVLARYADIAGTPPAILSVRYGAGIAILSGVHQEYSSADFSKDHPLYAQLVEIENSRKSLLDLIVKTVLANNAKY